MQATGPLPNYSPYTQKVQGYSDITTHLGPQKYVRFSLFFKIKKYF